jgi:hypothetical protein
LRTFLFADVFVLTGIGIDSSVGIDRHCCLVVANVVADIEKVWTIDVVVEGKLRRS